MGNKTLHAKGSLDTNEDSDSEESPLVIGATSSELQELEELRAEKKAREEAEKAAEKAAIQAAERTTMNLPPSSLKGIQMNGVLYAHGKTYTVSNEIKWQLEEQQNRAWSHESSLKEPENKGRKQRRAYVGS